MINNREKLGTPGKIYKYKKVMWLCFYLVQLKMQLSKLSFCYPCAALLGRACLRSGDMLHASRSGVLPSVNVQQKHTNGHCLSHSLMCGPSF